jgi:hypothetical protein
MSGGHCDRPVLGLTGRWRFPQKSVGTACLKVRFRKFRESTFDTKPPFAFPESGRSTLAINRGTQVSKAHCASHIVNSDHRSMKWITKSMLGFKSFRATSTVMAGIELMHMIRKGQMIITEGKELSFLSLNNFMHSPANCVQTHCALDKLTQIWHCSANATEPEFVRTTPCQ